MTVNVPGITHEMLGPQIARAILLDLPFIIWGEPGIGKSSVVEQTAKLYGYKIKIIHMSQLAPGDLLGILFPDVASGTTKQYPPSMLPGPNDPPTILFFDEYGAAMEMVRKPSTQIILEKILLEYVLAPQHRCCAASNTGDDGTLTHALDRATSDRFMHLHLIPHYPHWKNTYAKATGIDLRILHFLDSQTQHFCASMLEAANPDNRNNALNLDEIVPTPRSWAKVSQLIQGVTDIGLYRPLITGCLGTSTAAHFITSAEINEDFNTARQIMDASPENRQKMLPQNENSIVMLATNLAPSCGSMDDYIAGMHIAGLISTHATIEKPSEDSTITLQKYSAGEMASYCVDMLLNHMRVETEKEHFGRVLSQTNQNSVNKERQAQVDRIYHEKVEQLQSNKLCRAAMKLCSEKFIEKELAEDDPLKQMMDSIRMSQQDLAARREPSTVEAGA